MGSHFIAVSAHESIVAELGALSHVNPFATAGFFESRRQLGYDTWVLGLRNETNELVCGCGAFLRRGRLHCRLGIPSLPAVGADSSFWSGLREFCRHHGVTKVELGTFASPPAVEIPRFGTHFTRRCRCEFVLDLAGDLSAMLSVNHERNLKRAAKADLTVRRTRSVEASITHRALMSKSMDRRRSRGERVDRVGLSREEVAILQSGAGDLFQALRDATVLSSVLVLRAPGAGYYRSAGTSPEGMAMGASHFLIHRIARELSAEGAQIFNLGGAAEGSGLARFKEGFGASRVPLPAARCYIGSGWRLRASRAIDLMRSDRKALLRLLTWAGDSSSTKGDGIEVLPR